MHTMHTESCGHFKNNLLVGFEIKEYSKQI